MILRPRQTEFVDRCSAALRERRNTLGVAPTGAGKTVMLSAVTGDIIASGHANSALVLQHRDELVAQNRRTFHAVTKMADTGVVDASDKQFGRSVVFAMVPTLARDSALEAMRAPGLLVIDEAHHAAAKSYRKIIDRALELNPNVMLFGVTATPNRGDKKALRDVFDNVADQIALGELIATGALVRPRTFVVDIGVREELAHVRKQIGDFDMSKVSEIMDKEILNDQIVHHWKEIAGDRQTVVFCSTVEHALHVTQAFSDAGVSAAMVTGEMPEAARKDILSRYDRRQIQVVVNVAVLTEGWDCQPVSCVVLLRPSSYKSTMIQMVGRGLRRVDPERYPGVIKSDCVVLDFGTSTLMHGSLEQDVNLDGADKKGAPKKDCEGCGAKIPLACVECPICGHEIEPLAPAGGNGETGPKDALGDFVMTEVDLFKASPFKWEDIWSDGSVLVASAFDCWALAIFFAGDWHAIGGATGKGITHLAAGEKLLALATADDFMRANSEDDAATKTARWLHLPATDKQLSHLQIQRIAAIGITRYMAACKLTWKFNERGIRSKLESLRKRIAA